MFDRCVSAPEPALCVLSVVFGPFSLFVGVTVVVAVLHLDDKRRRDAFRVLRELLQVVRMPPTSGGDAR